MKGGKRLSEEDRRRMVDRLRRASLLVVSHSPIASSWMTDTADELERDDEPEYCTCDEPAGHQPANGELDMSSLRQAREGGVMDEKDRAMWRERMERVARNGVIACSGGSDKLGDRWTCGECPLGTCQERAAAYLEHDKEANP